MTSSQTAKTWFVIRQKQGDKRGVVRALLPRFAAADWLESINKAVSAVVEDPQFKGFLLYSMLPLSVPCRFNTTGPAYDGDFFLLKPGINSAQTYAGTPKNLTGMKT